MPLDYLPKAKTRVNKKSIIRPRHENCWKILAALDFTTERGLKTPKVRVWGSDLVRLQDKLPTRVLGPNWTGGKGSIELTQIKSYEVLRHIIFKRTFWGRALMSLYYNSSGKT